MILVLEVICYRGLVPAIPQSARFDESGGSIGRSEVNHLVLTDAGQIVSRNHADISFSNGCFIYVDNSRNGTRVCGENRMLFKGDSLRLEDGVCLELGEYQLQARIQVEDKSFFQGLSIGSFDHVPPPVDLDQAARSFKFDGPILAKERQASFRHEEANRVCDDPLSDWPSCKNLKNLHQSNAFVRDSAIEKHMDNEVSSFQTTVDEDAQTALPSSSLDAAMQPGVAQSSHDASADLFQYFLEGAGLEMPSDISLEDQMEAMKELGLVLRHMIEGLMAMLRARHEEKSAIRTKVTVLSGKNNNPLKFVPSVESAIHILLYKKYRKGYLDPVIAVQEGLADIRHHEMAMRAAIQASLADILKRFDPEPFEASLEKAGVFQSKQSKCWETYCRAYPGLANEAMDGLFKGIFVDVYENQVKRLNESYEKK